MNGSLWVDLLQTIAMRAPSLLVGGIGLYFAISRLGHHPKAARFAIVGFSCLLLTVVGFLLVQIWVMYSPTVRAEPGTAGEVFSYWNLVAYPVNLFALAGLGAAIFVDRKPATDAEN